MIDYREVKEPDRVCPALFEGFERHQEVTLCWRRENGEWVLKPIPFTETWTAEEYAELCGYLRNTLRTGGALFCAFDAAGRLAGFASVEGLPMGSAGQYRQLSALHVSHPMRGHGIGRKLLRQTAARAGQMGAAKLYLSAHPSKETQAFYKAMGCREAAEYQPQLVEAAPLDCQLELDVQSSAL